MNVTNDLKIITTIQRACVREKLCDWACNTTLFFDNTVRKKFDLGKCYELEITLIKLDFTKDIFRRKSIVDLSIRLDIVGARETKEETREKEEKKIQENVNTLFSH